MSADAADDELRLMVRAKIALGVLPREGALQFLPAFGKGQICSAFGAIIAPRASMYERGAVQLHRLCYDVWRAEI